MKSKYKTITVTIGLICLMGFCILAIMSTTGLFKAGATTARLMGIFIIAAGACLSLNAATTILDKPKENVPPLYRRFALAIVIGTGLLVLLWLIVLFTSDIGLIVKYIFGGKKFKISSTEYATYEAAMAAAQDTQKIVSRHLRITEITICATIIVAYLNLFVTRRFVFKNRMVAIQITLFFGAFLFYFWIFWFTLTAGTVYHTKVNQYVRLCIEPSVSMLINPLGFTIALSGLAMYIISRFASIGPMRRFKNEGLFEKEEITDYVSEEPKVAPQPSTPIANDTNDIKARIEKLKELHDQGLITDEEFEKKKKDIIDSL